MANSTSPGHKLRATWSPEQITEDELPVFSFKTIYRWIYMKTDSSRGIHPSG
ncbi:IS30 family transposase [Paenibacillus xylanexedens]|uniref:IS30 family transposase n=1 Tax=Paenibacillus xylanexedens TaxID=528191 RepID=A0ABS4RSH5_PAEXY|nr:IS30 family transposase [Paenibacillus xylanexedens]